MKRCWMVLACWAVWGAQAQGIYTCVDGQGRRLTSDRPIPECLDREQRELAPSGATKRALPPAYTASERAQIDVKNRQAAEERARQQDQSRRDRAMLTRYPNQAVHDQERAEALQTVANTETMIRKRLEDLDRQRKGLDAELEFYGRDRNKAPATLKRQLTEQEQAVLTQQRQLSDQGLERQRINTRFDEELKRLKVLWAQANTPAAPAASARR